MIFSLFFDFAVRPVSLLARTNTHAT